MSSGPAVHPLETPFHYRPPFHIDLGEPLRHAADMGRQLGERDEVIRQIVAVLKDADDPNKLARVKVILSEYTGDEL